MSIESARRVARRLREAGYEALFAGGCVRDRLRCVEPNDYDIATSAGPDEVQALFDKTVPVGAEFGVVLVIEDERRYEVAAFRQDVGSRDGRHPAAVRPTDARTDALRRDFTINGMFEDPESEEVLDYVNGREDLRAGIVRTIGDPLQRFTEDRLRMLRAVRFATVLDFVLDPETAAAVEREAGAIAQVSMERIQQELNRILTSGRGGRGLGLLHEVGLLDVVLPEVAAMLGVPQPPAFHPEGDVFTHTRMLLDDYRGGGIEVALAALLHDVAKPPTLSRDDTGRIRFFGHADLGAEMAGEILSRLRYSNDTVRRVQDLVARHMDWPNLPKMREAKRRRWLLRPDFDLHLELHRLDCRASHGDLSLHEAMSAERERIEAQPPPLRPLICGKTLIAMGFEPGPAFKLILDAVVDERLEGRLQSEDEARSFVERHYAPPLGEEREG
ncbi:MAG: CCA tRNA nucleotidyltransferase [Planctomycetota bacterium]|nr:CCA tRNA nucleotidyltransferase [Planctomycetota bacterium]